MSEFVIHTLTPLQDPHERPLPAIPPGVITLEAASMGEERALEARGAQIFASMESLSTTRNDAIYPIVEIHAQRLGEWIGSGVGFMVSGWSSVIITARHVVATANGTPPDSVLIYAWNGSRHVTLDALSVSYRSPDDDQRADVALLRVRGHFASKLVRTRPPYHARVEVRGYQAGADFSTTATRQAPWLRMDRGGFGGMSGGPVLLAPHSGQLPRQVIGVYTGRSDVSHGNTGIAYAIDFPAHDPTVEFCYRQLGA